MGPNFLITEEVALIGAVDADAYGAGTVLTAYVPVANWARIAALIAVGDFVSTGVLDAKLVQATDSSGTGSKDIAGKAITQMTQAGTDSNKQAWINARPEDLDLANGFTHVALSMTLTTAGADLAGYLFGASNRYGVASDSDAATVDEIVA